MVHDPQHPFQNLAVVVRWSSNRRFLWWQSAFYLTPHGIGQFGRTRYHDHHWFPLWWCQVLARTTSHMSRICSMLMHLPPAEPGQAALPFRR